MVQPLTKSPFYGRILELTRSFLNTNLKTWRVLTNPSPLIALRRRAIRVGVWWRMPPLRRALIDATIVFLRRGGVVRAQVLLSMVRDVVIEILTHVLSRNVVFTAYLIGLELLGRFGRYLDVVRSAKYVVYMGIQWLNTPPVFRWNEG
jgi:hypothetical protein